MAYASALLNNPATVYRQIDVAGRTVTDGPGLVQLMYEELIAALRSAAWAAENRQLSTKSERVTRATAILFALEAGLDFDKGGSVSTALATLYTGARQTIVSASLGNDPRPFRTTADNMAEIAQAWRTVRAA